MSIKDNPEYLESLQIFYSEKLKAGLKPKFSKCKGCSENKQFIVNEGKLYHTCGSSSSSSSSGKCGLQMEIDLATYIYYPETLNTRHKLDSLIDKTKYPDIYSKDEIKEHEDFLNDTDAILKEATKDFVKMNKLSDRFSLIQKNSKNRINMKKDQNLLMVKIKDEDNIIKKQNLIKDYVILNQQLLDDYKLMDETCKGIHNHIMTKQGSVNRESATFERLMKDDAKKMKDDAKKMKDDTMKDDAMKDDAMKDDVMKDVKPKQSLGAQIDKQLLPELQGLVKGNNNDMTMNIIVAYRDPGDGSRKDQLKIFKEQMNLIFKDQTDVQIYIIEQESLRPDYGSLPELIRQPNSEMAKFNLGLLKNIGFEIASKKKSKKQNYYILSDVDLLPSMNLVEDYLRYPKNPIHLANKGTRYNMNGKDANFLGGVISVSDKDFIKANGYPNNFWGWGGEDNALNRRLQYNKIRVEKPKEHVIDLEKLDLGEKLTKLKVDQTKELRKREKLDEDRKTWSSNGLSDISDKYKIVKKLKAKNITHVKVFLNIESEINLEEEEEEEDEEEEDGPTYAPGSPTPLREDVETDDMSMSFWREIWGETVNDNIEDTISTFMKRTVAGEAVCEELTKLIVPKAKQIEFRNKIYEEISGKITGDLTVANMKELLTDDLLIEMFNLYDKYYFGNKIEAWNKLGKCGWRICWADKCSINIFGETKIEEKSIGGTNYIKLVINDKAFKKAIDLFLENEDENMNNAGLECNDILSCIQITFEHEIVHGIMFCLCKKYMSANGPGDWHGTFNNKSLHSKTFMTILNNIFGQDEYTSDILSSEKTKQKIKEIMAENAKLFRENKVNFNVDDEVMFDGKVNKTIVKVIGIITKKNKKNVKVTDKKGGTWTTPYQSLRSIIKD